MQHLKNTDRYFLLFYDLAFCPKCCRVYSHTSRAALTCTLRERVMPCWGISTHTSTSCSRFAGMPSLSLLFRDKQTQAPESCTRLTIWLIWLFYYQKEYSSNIWPCLKASTCFNRNMEHINHENFEYNSVDKMSQQYFWFIFLEEKDCTF